MSASITSELKAEPNLTPLLDVVFQLITFFMLVINFSSENYDQRVRLPIADSARPVDDDQRISEDRLVLNVDSEGHLLIGGEVQPLHKALQTIKHQADLVRLNLKAAGAKTDGSKTPNDDHFPRGPRRHIRLADRPDQRMPVERVPEVRVEGHERCVTDRRRGVSERKKIQKSEEPQIPITPMLDMAFQLLTFFVLTYKPAPSEGQIIMNLLPAQPATAITAPAPSEKPSDALPATAPHASHRPQGGRWRPARADLGWRHSARDRHQGTRGRARQVLHRPRPAVRADHAQGRPAASLF